MQQYILEYVWIDGYNNVRSKVKVHNTNSLMSNISDFPNWNYDGSSTGQGTTEDSEVILNPVRYYNCPFRKNSNSFIVLCSISYVNTPNHDNYRDNAVKIFEKYKDHDAWYGLEQEYFVYDNKINMPLNYEKSPHTKYYCSVGENAYKLRELMEKHMDYCLYTGIKISGYNQEVAPGQSEFQIGPEEGLKVCDDLWVARFILQKLGEYYNVKINYHPKPILESGESCNGSGCHTNFSTINTRNKDGYDYIIKCMGKLRDKHQEHLQVYGIDNHLRLTGKNETSSIDTFSYSVGGRDCSVRIGYDTFYNKCGYFEDRRAASNMNPYLVCPLLLQTCVE